MGTPFPGKSPRSLGYRMPAEWERHSAVWLAWPHDPVTFLHLERVEETYIEIIEALHGSERVHLCVLDQETKHRIFERLHARDVDRNRVHLHLFDYADVWIRDYGPIFLKHEQTQGLAMVHWYFNAWGQKYETHLKDTRIPCLIHKKMTVPYFKPEVVLEGGSIDVNGRGTLLTTEQCLLHPNRNPHLDKEGIEYYLREYLGASHVIWLKQGVSGDDTDGHVDDIARFVNPTTVVCALESDETDENFSVLRENYEMLLKARDQDGEKLTVVKLPMPGPVWSEEGRLPASYANFYIANDKVLVPAFGHANDRTACEILEPLFPDRKIVPIRCDDLVYGLGALHCMTQQQPSVPHASQGT